MIRKEARNTYLVRSLAIAIMELNTRYGIGEVSFQDFAALARTVDDLRARPANTLVLMWLALSRGQWGIVKIHSLIVEDEVPCAIEGPRVLDRDGNPGGMRDSRYYWLFRHEAYSSELNLDPDEVKALILESENKVKLRVARAKFLMDATTALEATGNKTPREPIPDDIKMFVWNRDGGKCVACGSNRSLEFDHIIPLALGGSNTARNLQLLCETHNGQKGGRLF